jgi:FkbM family methyltransferase
MIGLWRTLLQSFRGRTGASPARQAPPTFTAPSRNSGSARPASMVPPGVFDWRPLVKRNTPHGVFCLPADYPGDAAARAIADGIPIADDLLELLRQHVAPGSVVLDIGAGFGRITALLSGLTGPAGQVLAFEADEYLCDVLQQTIRFNLCENVRVFFGAVDDGSRAAVHFPAAPASADAPYSGQRTDTAGDANLHTLTIDALQIAAPVSLLFVDVNGGELPALRGAAATIARFRPAVVLRFESALAAAAGYTGDDLAQWLGALGYAIVDLRHDGLCVATPRQSSPHVGNSTSAPDAVAHPDLVLPLHSTLLCKLLRNRAEVDQCTLYLKKSGYVPHNIECKNWDIAHIVPAVGDGNFLDMGSSHSYVLKNLALKRIRGELCGIDLRAPDVAVAGVRYLIGDLIQTPLPDGHFANISCLSVLEHDVDYDRFAAEAARLLAANGRLFVTFDYWEPRVTPPLKLYDLDWRLLDAAMVRRFIAACTRHGLDAVAPFDFTAGDALINAGYYSPHPEVSYTFGMAVFEKNGTPPDPAV